jgi:uracil-DNA glycosylase
MKSSILTYQQKVFREYSNSIGLPPNYAYPDGNPIRPVPPIQTKINGLMIVGAYPSARFENRKATDTTNKYRLIPVGDNLQPFADEEYFDGLKVRKLVSGIALKKNLLDRLGLDFRDCWITNLVKVFLYKQEHMDSYKAVDPYFKRIQILRNEFINYGKKSLDWLEEEVQLCNPKVIVTLGHEVAQVVSGNKNAKAEKILQSEVDRPVNANGVPTVYAPHPDACRRFEKWRKIMEERVELVKRCLS